MEWIIAAIVLTVIFLGLVLVTGSWFATRHEVYDDGNGGVKVRCPDGDGHRTVYGSVVICPFCGLKLDPPTKKHAWQKR